MIIPHKTRVIQYALLGFLFFAMFGYFFASLINISSSPHPRPQRPEKSNTQEFSSPYCVSLLLTRKKDLKRFIGGVDRLFQNFILQCQVKPDLVLMWQDIDISEIQSKLKEYEEQYGVNVHYYEVKVTFPEYYTLSKEKRPKHIERWNWRYLHMCRFYSYTFFRLEFFRRYRYVLRLDADLFFDGPLPCDPFQHMEKHGLNFLYYGYPRKDHLKSGRPLLKSMVSNYTALHGVVPASPLPEWGWRYWGGFGLFNTQFWISPEVQHFLTFMDLGLMAYRDRVGEQMIYPFVTALFGGTDKTYFQLNIRHLA